MANVIGQGSFRNVPFLIVESAERSGGNRLVQHDYPLRDTGRVQNMGSKAEATTIQVIVNGKDALEQRDKLVDALNKSDAGELHHPNFAPQIVYIQDWKQTISTDAQRTVKFSISYIAADIDDDSPITQQNGKVTLLSAIESLVDSTVDEFNSFCDTVNLASSRIAETLDFAESIATTITKAVRGITGATGLSTILSSGLAFKASIKNLLNSPSEVIRELSELLGAIKDIGGTDSGSSLSAIKLSNNSASSPNTHTQAIQVTVNTLILANQTALALDDANKTIKASNNQNSESSSETTSSIVTLSDCEQAILLLGQELQSARISASDLYFQDTAKNIREVRRVFVEQMQLLSSKLPSSITKTNAITEPALVTLYRETGDSLQVNRFTKRNAIKHPTFAIGGQEYEVINETNS